MSFSGRTPESLLPRSDSKNPATTCKGLTANGRPCRRALAGAGSKSSSPVPSPSRNGLGVLAVLDRNDAAAFYCWQHKDQAESLAAQPEQRTTLFPLREKSSIDSIAEKVGVVDLDSEVGSRTSSKNNHGRRQDGNTGLTKREKLPSGWHKMEGPLMTVPEEYVQPRRRKSPDFIHGRSNVKASWLCCIKAGDSSDEDKQYTRRRPQAHRNPMNAGYTRPLPMATESRRPSSTIPHKPVPSKQQPYRSTPERPSQPATPSPRPIPQQTTPSQTQALLSLIPSTASPQTASLLLAELSKPFSPTDESGYIYIFWLTPDSFTYKPDDKTASSLLTDDDAEPSSSDSDSDAESSSPSRRPRQRNGRGSSGAPCTPNTNHRSKPQLQHKRQTAAIQRYASVRLTAPPTPRSNPAAPIPQPTAQRTILLKIGRASNVHRRMTQWSKQCGKDITLVRFYPYHTNTSTKNPSSNNPSASASAPPAGMVKCPHITRIERLIHLELADQRVVDAGKCENCGREHKEWFEVRATRRGLRGVDAVVRKWVGFGMGLG